MEVPKPGLHVSLTFDEFGPSVANPHIMRISASHTPKGGRPTE